MSPPLKSPLNGDLCLFTVISLNCQHKYVTYNINCGELHMHRLNQLRLLSGIPVDASLESEQTTQSLTEARKVPLRRTDLTAKDQRSLSTKLKGLQSAIKHVENAIKSLDKIPSTDFGGDIPHAIAELESILDGENGATGLTHLLDSFENDHKTQVNTDKHDAKVKAEEEEANEINASVELGEAEEPLSESWWNVEVRNHPDTKGFRIQAEDRATAESKATARLAQMRGNAGAIGSVKIDANGNTNSIDSTISKQIDDMSDEVRNELVKNADIKSRSGSKSLTKQEEYLLRTNKQEQKPQPTSDKEGVDESMHYYVDNQYTNYEDDEDKPVNVTDGSANDEQVWDGRNGNHDESPSQLNTKQDDMEQKMNVPSSITNQLKVEIDQARAESKKLSRSNGDAARFYNDLADTFEELQDKMSSGNIHDFKAAQILAQSLMGPMLHKIPGDVWKFLANGGKARSLKSYMQEVK